MPDHLPDADGRKPISVITAERFDEMLNILPPCRWDRFGRFEMFHISERQTGNVVPWFICFHGDCGKRCFTLDDDAALTTSELLERVRAFAWGQIAALESKRAALDSEIAALVGGAA